MGSGANPTKVFAAGTKGSGGKAEDVSRKRAEDPDLPPLPPPPPSLTDQIIQAARRAEADRLKVGRTRVSSFVAANRSIFGG